MPSQFSQSTAGETPKPFIGTGELHSGRWFPTEDGPPEANLNAYGHPARYEADTELVAAVNTAILLGKPLLLTGNPGTGKSELAERIAWEFQLGPVLRFEAQSLSEVGDLFYRYDLVGRMAEARIQSDTGRSDCFAPGNTNPASSSSLFGPTHPVRFIEFGALGKAIFRSGAILDDEAETNGRSKDQSAIFGLLRDKICRNDDARQPCQSVVLIDEIDKASRDFPNDLLNGIDRMEFRIRELDNLLIAAPRPVKDRSQVSRLRPIVVITSNQERELPAPFMRRCAFHHIGDPDRSRMSRIIRLRVFPDRRDLDGDQLPPFYRELLDCFFAYREQHARSQNYEVGTTELLDVAEALRRKGIQDDATVVGERERVRQVLALIAKHREDIGRLSRHLESWQPSSG